MSFRSLLNEKFREALRSTLPIVGIVLLLCFTIAPIPSSLLMTFVVGAMLLIVGIAFFTLGADTAMTPIGKLPAVEELSNILLYAVVSLLATQAPLNDLLSAPMWVVYGLFILAIHVVLMFLLSKVFHWDLCMVSTASVANIGGSASAPIIAVAYHESYAGIGVLMGVLGAAIGNFFGLGMGAILHLMA